MNPAQSGREQAFALNLITFVTIALSFVWHVLLPDYTLHLVAGLIVGYLFYHFFKKDDWHKTHLDIFVATAVVFLLVFHTGALYSPIFFLLYFLLFGTSLLLSPTSAYVLAISGSVFFLTSLSGDPVRELLQILSLFLIAPIANAFGSQYVKLLEKNKRIKFLEDEQKQMKEQLQNSKETNNE